jgi:hypothetical protein
MRQPAAPASACCRRRPTPASSASALIQQPERPAAGQGSDLDAQARRRGRLQRLHGRQERQLQLRLQRAWPAEGGVDYAHGRQQCRSCHRRNEGRRREAAKADIIAGKITVHDYMSDNNCPTGQARCGSLTLERDAQSLQALRNFASRGSAPIVAIGFNQANALGQVASEFPEEDFAIVDMVVEQPNVRSYVFKEHEGAYIGGLAGRHGLKNRTIGFVGGMDIPIIQRFLCGYKQGALAANPANQGTVRI